MVRVKCTHCEASEHVAYHVVDKAGDAAVSGAEVLAAAGVTEPVAKRADGRPTLDEAAKRVASSPIRAESCDDCHSYRKIFYQDKDPFVEPVADDLASLALDVLMGEAGYARANGNPLLWQNAEDA